MQNHAVWDDVLYIVDIQFNAEVSKTTGFSPFFLEHGRSLILPQDLGMLPDEEPLNHTGYAAQLVEERRAARAIVDEVIAKHRAEQLVRETLHHKELPSFPVGSQVWIRVGNLENLQAWQPRYTGPYTVVEAPTPSTRRIDGLPLGDYPVVHVQRLQTFNQRQANRNVVEPLDDQLDTADQRRVDREIQRLNEIQGDVYEAEKILEECQDKEGNPVYLIKWKDYPLSK